jgi:uncharacterized protein (DUF488 family)
MYRRGALRMKIYTIGFTKKTAAAFFGILQANGIQRLVDVRLNNISQLAGFAKRDDLRYFLNAICGVEYVHEPLLAPTQEMLDAYKKAKGSWQDYAARFLELMAERRIETAIAPALFDVSTVLLCSEPTAEQCHRRLVVEYLHAKWGDVTGHHL